MSADADDPFAVERAQSARELEASYERNGYAKPGTPEAIARVQAQELELVQADLRRARRAAEEHEQSPPVQTLRSMQRIEALLTEIRDAVAGQHPHTRGRTT